MEREIAFMPVNSKRTRYPSCFPDRKISHTSGNEIIVATNKNFFLNLYFQYFWLIQDCLVILKKVQ